MTALVANKRYIKIMKFLNNVEVMIYRSSLFDKIFVPYAVKIQRWYRGLVLMEEAREEYMERWFRPSLAGRDDLVGIDSDGEEYFA